MSILLSPTSCSFISPDFNNPCQTRNSSQYLPDTGVFNWRQNLNIHLLCTKGSCLAGQILLFHLTISTVKPVFYYFGLTSSLLYLQSSLNSDSLRCVNSQFWDWKANNVIIQEGVARLNKRINITARM